MHTSIPLIAAVFALPFFTFGCAVNTMSEDEAPDVAEEAEITATAEQAITATQRVGVGKIFDTGAAMGFAEFFASLVDWSNPAAHTQGDYDRMNASLLFVAGAPPNVPGTFDDMKKAISSPNTSSSCWIYQNACP
jgi:hypothetical protein